MSLKLRPLLFRRLILRSTADVTFLSNTIRSRVSSWLAPHIQRLGIDFEQGFSSSIAALPRLPFLQSITHYPQCSSPEGQNVLHSPRLRPHLSRLPSLTYLGLSWVTFPSFSSLIRLLGTMPTLESVDLKDVGWQVPYGLDEFPNCSSGFTSLLKGECWRMPSASWPIAWLFSATCLGYSYRRYHFRNGLAEVQAPPADLLVLVSIVNLVLTSMVSYLSKFEIRKNEAEGEYLGCMSVQRYVDR